MSKVKGNVILIQDHLIVLQSLTDLNVGVFGRIWS